MRMSKRTMTRLGILPKKIPRSVKKGYLCEYCGQRMSTKTIGTVCKYRAVVWWHTWISKTAYHNKAAGWRREFLCLI